MPMGLISDTLHRDLEAINVCGVAFVNTGWIESIALDAVLVRTLGVLPLLVEIPMNGLRRNL